MALLTLQGMRADHPALPREGVSMVAFVSWVHEQFGLWPFLIFGALVLASLTHTRNDARDRVMGVALVFALVFFGLRHFGLERVAPGVTDPAQPNFSRRAYRVVGSETFGCRDAATMKRFTRLIGDGDKQAFGRLLADSYLSGECRDLALGMTVHMVETSLLAGLVKVREEGSLDELWVLSRSVQR